MEELQEFSEQEESNFDFKAELYKYLSHWKWLLFGCIIGLIIAALYNRYSIPEYKTTASMMILNEKDNQVVGALPSGGASILSLDGSSLENQIETLRSKRLISAVVDRLDLNILYLTEGNVITVESYENSSVVIEFFSPDSLIYQSQLDILIKPQSESTFELVDKVGDFSKKFNFGEPISYKGLDFTIKPRNGKIESKNPVNIQLYTLWDTATYFSERLEIHPKGKAKDILSLSITGSVKQKSEDFLNTLMLMFNTDGVADKRQVAESTSKFIQDRLQLITEELDSVEGGIADFKKENSIMDVASSAGQFMAKSTKAEQDVFTIETQLMVLESITDALTSAKPYQLLPANVGIQDGSISSQINEYNTLVLERNALLKTGTAKNPVVEVLSEQLDALRENILNNISNIRQSMRINLRELNQLDRMAEGRFSTFPGLEKGIRSKERQQQIKEQLYLFLLQRREESAISFAATSPVAKVIDPAYTLYEPVDPKPGLILAGGGLIGFLIPLIVIFVINFLNTKIHHKGDLQPLTKEVPFLGEVPRIIGTESEIIQLNDRSPLAESFRILRTNLAYLVQSRNREKAEVIYVTSTIKGEGKTFISYNLARTLASTGKKVLLIGADIRNPRLHKYTHDELTENKGLSDFLYNHDLEAKDIITKENHENIEVDMIFSGSIPPNPAELLMNDRMEDLINGLKADYSFIIVDTAPTMIVTDTLLISQLADTTIYVTRAGFTEKKLLEFPKDLKQQGKLKGLAVVLNDVDYSKFSYGAKYGYAYGYGYGYSAEEEKKGLKKFFSNPFK
jgi:tyrosine-protein kinase Etk/Wzc